MAYSIIMPKAGMAMEEGTLLAWRIRPGDRVEKGQPVAEIETDKTVMELESDWSGTVLALLCREGDTVPVAGVMAWVGEPGILRWWMSAPWFPWTGRP